MKKAIETSIVNGFHTILREIKLVQHDGTPPEDMSVVLSKLFDREVTSSNQGWGFFDDIMTKHLDATSGTLGATEDDDRDHRLACTLVAVCLSEYDDFVKFIFDIFGSAGSGEMTLHDYAGVLKTILPSHVEDSVFDDHVNSFFLYLSAHPLMAEGPDCTPSSAFPGAIAAQYHTKTHRKQVLWPLKVAQEQVKMKFLGVNYWVHLHKDVITCPEATAYLPANAADFASFVDTLSGMFSSLRNVAKLPNSGALPTTFTPSDASPLIVENHGMYTYRHHAKVGALRGINKVLKDSFSTTDTCMFPHAMQHGVVAPGRAHVSDMNRDLSRAARSMVGLQMLIIEDSRLQRKMMRRSLTSMESSMKDVLEAKEKEEKEKEEAAVFEFSETKKSLDAPSSTTTGSSPRSSPVPSLAPREECSVSEATNGEEAIQMIIDTKRSFDVIFVDENLSHSGGNMLGHEFVSILRGHSSVLPTTVIIGCSANAEMYVSNFLEAGADAVWKKPMPAPEVIYAEICKYIATRSKHA